jgi:hypothetical protein
MPILRNFMVSDAILSLQEKDVTHDNLLDQIDNDYYSKSDIDTMLMAKSNGDFTYSKIESDLLLSLKPDMTNIYSKLDIDNMISGKANIVSTYNKTQVDALIDGCAVKLTTYTKTEVDSLLSALTLSSSETLNTGETTVIQTMINTSLSSNNANYTTTSAMNLKFADYFLKTETYSITQADLAIANAVGGFTSSSSLTSLLNAKADATALATTNTNISTNYSTTIATNTLISSAITTNNLNYYTKITGDLRYLQIADFNTSMLNYQLISGMSSYGFNIIIIKLRIIKRIIDIFIIVLYKVRK